MKNRPRAIQEIRLLLKENPAVALLGPRQCGKSTLAKQLGGDHYFDLENPRDLARLSEPQLALESLTGLVVIDEIQLKPDLFPLLRYLIDHHPETRYLLLGSASQDLIQQSSETLAGRIAFYHLQGFTLDEVGNDAMNQRWVRGGFPRAFLADSDEAASRWLENYIQTFLQRDLAEFGYRIPASTMRRFWTMLSHCHGSVINYSELGRSLQTSDKTVRKYLDILASTLMVRVLQPWHSNTSKRLVKNPKVYLNDSGIFHRLQMIETLPQLQGHPKLGASWEGFALNQLIQELGLSADECFFWATHAGAEVDLFWKKGGKNYAAEFKYADAPRSTKSMHSALQDLDLDHLWVVHPGKDDYPLNEKITVLGIRKLGGISTRIG